MLLVTTCGYPHVHASEQSVIRCIQLMQYDNKRPYLTVVSLINSPAPHIDGCVGSHFVINPSPGVDPTLDLC